jgi:uncharacterized protein YdeI (YjbR/CyaY-like superfamily)
VPKEHPLVNAYIHKSADFAQPILHEIRCIVHSYCPDITETIKWGFPHFEYKGTILCSMAAFKQHCSVGFWLQSHMEDSLFLFKREREGGMGSLGKIRRIEDVPKANELGIYLLEAMNLIDQGVKLKKTDPKNEKKLEIPVKFQTALDADPVAKSVFDHFSFSHKREYVDWLSDAKTEATFNKRLETTIFNLRDGKSKEWKYRK